MGRSTISQIIRETCDAIYTSLRDSYLHPTCVDNDWNNISKEFSDLWKVLRNVGAIDGKHFGNSGTLFFKNKSFCSIFLLAIFEAKYNFILFDVGQYGSCNEYSVLSKNTMRKPLESKPPNIPEPTTFEGC